MEVNGMHCTNVTNRKPIDMPHFFNEQYTILHIISESFLLGVLISTSAIITWNQSSPHCGSAFLNTYLWYDSITLVYWKLINKLPTTRKNSRIENKQKMMAVYCTDNAVDHKLFQINKNTILLPLIDCCLYILSWQSSWALKLYQNMSLLHYKLQMHNHE